MKLASVEGSKVVEKDEPELRTVYWWANPLNWLRPTPIRVIVEEETHDIDKKIIEAIKAKSRASAELEYLRVFRREVQQVGK